jgi:hypothetical protein
MDSTGTISAAPYLSVSSSPVSILIAVHTVSTFGALRLVTCPLDRQTPLCKRTIVINFKPLGRGE